MGLGAGPGLDLLAELGTLTVGFDRALFGLGGMGAAYPLIATERATASRTGCSLGPAAFSLLAFPHPCQPLEVLL